MNTLLWTLQILFAVLFFAHGLMLALQPASMQSTLEPMPYSRSFLRFIGVCEMLGGVGLVLPWCLGVAHVLTPLAAAGLAVITVGAAAYHLRARETPPGIATSTLGVLLVVVAVGRW